MEFFRDSNIDFMKYRKVFVVISAVLVAVAVFTVFVRGHLNLGIDFAGGTQLTLQFREEPDIERVRSVVLGAGVEDALIQRFGDEDLNEILVKTPTVEGREEGSESELVRALDQAFNGAAAGSFDLNRRGGVAIGDELLRLDPDQLRAQDEESARAHYENVADAIAEVRKDVGLITSWDEVGAADGVTPEALAALRENATLGSFAVLGSENVGPQIGSELRQKGILAVVMSLLGMLVYIWFRFELRYGIGALAALAHDVVIVLGLYALAGFEFNLTTIAAFLTLVGYSVNDTVVVFDRVRENLRQSRRMSLKDVMNQSINQTLSRTVLTSGTTLLAVGSLFFLGGDVLRGFGFILTIGVLIGTYSSIYVASPFALLWERFVKK